MSQIKNFEFNGIVKPPSPFSGANYGRKSEVNPRLVFDNSYSTHVQVRKELKTLSKFATHITPIDCDSDEEKELKAKLEEVILSDIEKKIDDKVKRFTEKLITNVKNVQRRANTGTSVPYEYPVGKTEIGGPFENEEGWYLGGTTGKQVRVDKERLDQLKRNAKYLELGNSGAGMNAQLIDVEGLKSKMFAKDSKVMPKYLDPKIYVGSNEEGLDHRAPKVEEENNLQKFAEKTLGKNKIELKPETLEKIATEINKIITEDKATKKTKKKTTKKSTKKAVKKSTKKKVSKKAGDK